MKEDIYNIGTAIFNSKLRTLNIRNNKSIILSPKESKLLEILYKNVNNLTHREYILQSIWRIQEKGKEDDISKSVDVYINKIRGYFRNDPNVRIDNIHGSGFCLVDELNK